VLPDGILAGVVRAYSPKPRYQLEQRGCDDSHGDDPKLRHSASRADHRRVANSLECRCGRSELLSHRYQRVALGERDWHIESAIRWKGERYYQRSGAKSDYTYLDRDSDIKLHRVQSDIYLRSLERRFFNQLWHSVLGEFSGDFFGLRAGIDLDGACQHHESSRGISGPNCAERPSN
jgi:hypothetical protein